MAADNPQHTMRDDTGARVPALVSLLRLPDEPRGDSWWRWAWWMQLGSMAVSIAALILVLVGEAGGLRIGLIAMPVVLVSMGWSWLALRASSHLERRLWPAIAFSLVDLALLVTLILIHPAFGLGIFFVYWRMFTVVRPPWSIAMAAIISLSIYKAFDGFSTRMLSGTQIGILVLALIGSTVLAMFIGSIIAESQSRRVLLDQLQTTRAQLAAQERDAGMAAERQRIAGELHDTLAQDFASIVMHLEAAGALEAEGLPVASHLDAAKDVARSGLAESRRIVRALRPEMLQGRSLPVALDALCARWGRERGIESRFVLSGEETPLPREVDVTLYRGLQEALTNVWKHAQATCVVATLSYLGDEVILDVRDDGVGFDSLPHDGRDSGESLGLLTMRERAEACSGTVTIESGPGRGTTVTMQIPLSPGVRGEE